MKKHSCRMTDTEKEMHDRAVKIRKMTDEQLCKYIDDTQGKNDTRDKSVSKFLTCVAGLKGIGKTTENKLYYLAREKGFIDSCVGVKRSMHDIFKIRNNTQITKSLKINTILKKRGLTVYVLIVKRRQIITVN